MNTFQIIDDSIEISSAGTLSLFFLYKAEDGTEYGTHPVYDSNGNATGETAPGYWIDFPPSGTGAPVDMDFINSQLQGSADDFFEKLATASGLETAADDYNSQLADA